MPSRHLDLGCGAVPRNPYKATEVHGIDIALPAGADTSRFRAANLAVDAIPHADSTFDSISAYDFLEHMPRVLLTADGRSTRFPFVELMNEIHRVLKPGGRLFALTPAWPRAEAFHDPTHVNPITLGTAGYFCGERPGARMYGFEGSFSLLRNEWALLPEARDPGAILPLPRRFKRWRRRITGALSHVVWEFQCVKS